jgi:hypothetical protein
MPEWRGGFSLVLANRNAVTTAIRRDPPDERPSLAFARALTIPKGDRRRAICKEWRVRLRKDDVDVLPFPNIGQAREIEIVLMLKGAP